MKLKFFALAMAVTMAVLFSVALALPHDPYIRYQSLSDSIFDRAKWIYERIHFDETPLDVVFLGPSRTERAVGAPVLEAALRERGVDRRVANFALPSSGFDLSYALAREALENRKVELLVVSLVEQFPRDGHQAFGDLGSVSDVVRSPLLVNRNLPRNLAYLPVREAKLALKTLVPDAFGYQRGFDPATYQGTSGYPTHEGDPADVPRKTAEEIAALDEESAFRRRTLTAPLLPESLAWVEFGVSRSYIEKIAALAARHGTKIVFLYLPFYEGFEQPSELEWVRQFGPVLSAHFLRSAPDNFYDVAHASASGAALVSEWLAGELAPILQDSAQEQP